MEVTEVDMEATEEAMEEAMEKATEDMEEGMEEATEKDTEDMEGMEDTEEGTGMVEVMVMAEGMDKVVMEVKLLSLSLSHASNSHHLNLSSPLFTRDFLFNGNK